MKKIIISNRVFWAGVVLASAALVGHNVGRTAPPAVAEVRTHRLVVVDETGKAVISLSSPSKDTATLFVGNESITGSVAILSSPKSGSGIVIAGKDKSKRFFGVDPSQDGFKLSQNK